MAGATGLRFNFSRDDGSQGASRLSFDGRRATSVTNDKKDFAKLQEENVALQAELYKEEAKLAEKAKMCSKCTF
jgi:hypothetical protein